MSSYKTKSFDYKISDEAVKAIEESLLPRMKDEDQLLLSWRNAALSLVNMGLATELPEIDSSQFFNEIAVRKGFPRIAACHTDMFFRYLSRGNMAQLGFDYNTGMYSEVIFIYGNKLYYMSKHLLGIYSYNPFLNKNMGTDNYKNLLHWRKITLMEKYVPQSNTSDKFKYLRLILYPQSCVCTKDLHFNKCDAYYLIYASQLVIPFHRLVFYTFYPCTDYLEFRNSDVNHMLASSDLFYPAMQKLSVYDSYGGDIRKVFSEFASLPYFLELSNPTDNKVHGAYTKKKGYRGFPVSVEWVPEDTDSLLARDNICQGVNILMDALHELQFGSTLFPCIWWLQEEYLYNR